MSVHAIRDKPPVTDVPGQLRKLADDIEAENYGEVAAAVVVLEAMTLPIFGFGGADPKNASELLACAQQKLLLIRMNYMQAIPT